MSLVGFDGAAGTGKTTRLVSTVRAHLTEHPLGEEQRVLALTKMHGSRRRMLAKLSGRAGLGVPVDCMTIDSFAWRMVRRWRSLLRARGVTMPQEVDWALVTAAAGELLTIGWVARWVTTLHPVVVVDELQDCRDGELHILQGLEPHCAMFVAADEFQDLNGTGQDTVDWARAVGTIATLDFNHRTGDRRLLEAAAALRAGGSMALGTEWTGIPVGAGPGSARVDGSTAGLGAPRRQLDPRPLPAARPR